MTISSVDVRRAYNGNGVTDAFATPYFVLDADLKVYVDNVLQTLSTHYSLTGVGVAGGGTCTFVTPPPTGVSNVVIVRDPELTQGLDLVENDRNPAESREQAFDKLTMIAQRLGDQIDRSFRISDSDSTPEANLELPLPSLRSNKYVAFDADGQLVLVVGSAESPDTVTRVNDLASLRTVAPTTGQVIYVRNHTDGVSGGGGAFEALTAGGPYTDDNGVTIVPTGGDGSVAWRRVVEGPVSVKMFGARGDGVTDDKTAIQSCINLAPAHVYFPPGIYLVGSSLNMSASIKGLTLFGDAWGQLGGTDGTANIKLGFDGVLFDIDGGGVTTAHGITFENLRLDGDGGGRTAGTAIYVHGLSRNVYIKYCHIVSFYDKGVHVAGAGGVHLRDSEVFNCGYNLYGDGWADSTVIGGQSGSGAAGGAAWVLDNIYLLGNGGNTHFINHRPNFSAGIGVRIGGNVTRCSFVGGLCDNNLGHGFSLEDNCTAIKIVGMDIFDNGTTSVNKSGIDITTSQGATGFQGRAGISIVGNSIFDRNQGTVNETMDTGISVSTVSGSITDIAITGNDLTLLTNKITTLSNLRLKPGVEIEGNVGVKTQLSGITSATIATDSTGIKTISGVDVSALAEALHSGSIAHFAFYGSSHLDFAGTIFPSAIISGTTFDIKVNITTASATPGATTKIAWTVENFAQG